MSGDGPDKVPSVEGDNDCGFPLMNIRAMAREPPCPGKPAPREGRQAVWVGGQAAFLRHLQNGVLCSEILCSMAHFRSLAAHGST